MTTFRIGHIVAPEKLRNKDCYDWYHTMRKYAPVSYDRQRRCWDVFHYNDIKQVLLDYKTFSSERSTNQIDSLLSMDPPEHKRFRSLADRDFSHRYIQQLESLIVETVDQTLDELASKSQIDFMHEVATKIPILTIMKLLGIDEDYFNQIKERSIAALSRSDTTEKRASIVTIRKIVKAANELGQFFDQQIMEKMRAPQEDLMSHVLQKNLHQFEPSQLRDFFRGLLVAGSDTSVNLIGNSLYLFLRDQNILTKLQQQPAMLSSAIEESIRFHPSVHCVNRFATRDSVIGSETIRAGDEVVVWLASANRDEQIFTDAEEFQIDRTPNPHLSFGTGIHYCLGNSLARLEAKIIFTKLFARFPNIRLKINERPPYNNNFVFRGHKQLLVELN